MANLKQFFGDGPLTYEELAAAIKESGSKFVDLTEGNYVAKQKYDAELQSLNSQIETLNGTLGTRDTDLADLKAKLEAAGVDNDKLTALTKDLETLQGKYDTDTKQYQEKLSKQAYEFAVRELAATKEFSSQAAKREFIRAMVDENLKMKDGKIIGADDFINGYMEENADSFIVEADEYYGGDDNDEEDYETDYEEYVPEYTPQFVGPTPGGEPTPDATQAFLDAMHFTGVRPAP